MKALYLDCFAGISGNMFLGALLQAGVPTAYLEKELANRKKLGKAIAITAVASLVIGYAAGESQLVEKVIVDPLYEKLTGGYSGPTGLVDPGSFDLRIDSDSMCADDFLQNR